MMNFDEQEERNFEQMTYGLTPFLIKKRLETIYKDIYKGFWTKLRAI